jgi:hypothetical protein
MNNSTSAQKISLFCYDESDHFIYIEEVLIIVGTISNLICLIVFTKILKQVQSCQLYNYLFMKSLNDFFMFLLLIINPFYKLDYFNNIRYLLVMQIWYKYYDHYFKQVFKLMSILFEVIATFDCYISIVNNSKLKFLITKSFFYINTSIVFVFSVLFILIKLFVYDIVLKADKKRYTIVKNQLYYSDNYRIFSFLNKTLRNLVLPIVLIIINILIYIQLRNISTFKKNLTSNNSIAVSTSIKAKENKIKMILACTINLILLQTPSIFYSFFGKFTNNDSFWECYGALFSFLSTISYITPILIYFSYNKVFKEYFRKTIIRTRES